MPARARWVRDLSRRQRVIALARPALCAVRVECGHGGKQIAWRHVERCTAGIELFAGRRIAMGIARQWQVVGSIGTSPRETEPLGASATP